MVLRPDRSFFWHFFSSVEFLCLNMSQPGTYCYRPTHNMVGQSPRALKCSLILVWSRRKLKNAKILLQRCPSQKKFKHILQKMCFCSTTNTSCRIILLQNHLQHMRANSKGQGTHVQRFPNSLEPSNHTSFDPKIARFQIFFGIFFKKSKKSFKIYLVWKTGVKFSTFSESGELLKALNTIFRLI